MSIKITYAQCTEEEAKGIALRNGAVYRPEDLLRYKYVDSDTVLRVKQATPFTPLNELKLLDTEADV